MNVPGGYDAITLNHWLWFKHLCHEGTATEFQRLFEQTMKRARPEFIQIRPYGKIGDRKCDGMFYADGGATVFQVYSPDEFKQAELQTKIDQDFDGAYQHWRASMRRWVFVYNARRGLPPDVPKLLETKVRQYPDIDIQPLSSDGLWEIARALPLQQRSEILGAPNGYEHLFLAGSTPHAVVDSLHDAFFVLVHDLMSPISMKGIVEALRPAKPFGAPLPIRPALDGLPWTEAARQQKVMVEEVVAKGRDLLPRFAVFSLAPIPLAVHLGFVLSDRVEVHCRQFNRDTCTWHWPAAKKPDCNFLVRGLPNELTLEPAEVSIAVSLSASIDRADVAAAAPLSSRLIEIGVAEPDVMWLRSAKQLKAFARCFRESLAAIRSRIPRCTRIHLFYAGPTGGAVVLGQQINPRMNPPVYLYQYSRQAVPAHSHALTLTEDLA